MGESNYILRRGLWGAALLLFITSAGHLCAQSRSFDVEAGNARTTLREFARQARVSVVVDRRNVNGVRTNEVSGVLIPKQALERMLEGTSLVFDEDLETGAFAVTRSTEPVAEETRQMPEGSSEALAVGNETKRTIGSLFKGVISLALETSPKVADRDEGLEDSVFELSPFAVDARADDGYAATETLAGTRLRTSVRDVGAAMTIMTPEFLEDVGVTNFEEALQYAPNTSAYDSGQIELPNGTNSRIGIVYNVRGIRTDSLSRDFFGALYPADMYNTERLTFSRGPNSILFGIGNPGGVTNSVSKRARFGKVREIGFKVDDLDSSRATFDLNQEVIEGKLVLRVAGLYDDKRFWRKPAHVRTERRYAALKLKPLADVADSLSDLEFNATYEKGETDAIKPMRNEPVYDFVTPWLEASEAAGGPIYWDNSTYADPNAEEGTEGLLGIGKQLVVSRYSPLPGASVVPALNAVRTTRGTGWAFDQANGSGFRSLLDQSILPYDVNPTGGANSYTEDFETVQVVVNKRLIEDLHLEVAYNFQDYDRAANDEVRSFGNLQVDTNRYLPPVPGSSDPLVPNPMLGQYYIDTGPNIVQDFNRNRLRTLRYSLSYEFDFADHADGWMKRLGKIRAAAAYEELQARQDMALFQLRNLTPELTNEAMGFVGPAEELGFDTRVWTIQNQVRHRHYIDAENNVIKASGASYPRYWADTPIPTDEADEYGVTLGLLGTGQAHNNESITDSKVIALQHYLFDDRLITTWGWREDSQERWDANPAIVADRNPETRATPDPRPYDPFDYPEYTLYREGTPQTFGMMAYPVPQLGVFYNESENFIPIGRQVDLFGEPYPNQTGEGKDYGIKLFLFGNRLSASLGKFETESKNRGSGFIRTGAAGSIATDFTTTNRTIWATVEEITGDIKYSTNPYYQDMNLWNGLMDATSEGYEFQMTFNPTRQWRIMFNYSEQEGVLKNVGGIINEYWNEFVPTVWDDAWNTAELADANGDDLIIQHPGGRTSETLGELYANTRIDASRITTLSDTADTRQPLSSMNLVANYTFAEDSVLKGLSIGGSMRLRGDKFLGYGKFEGGELDGTLDASKQFRGGDTEIYDAMIRYRKNFKKVNWSIQLNIRNLLDDTDLLPASIDGLGVGNVVRWNFQAPRTYQLTNTFRF